ncbi:MAG: sulfatase [Verrucomicrobia bacterium]|nr:sulfatase [Verrucomicrobiota bacterium]
MNWYTFLHRILLPATAILSVVGPLSLLARAADLPVATTRPNVLFIIIDDHGPNLHNVFQHSPVRTPNMQRLANRGTWFAHAYVDAPACCPSRTAFLTGVHAAKSGVYYNNQAYRRATSWISKVETLPGHFRKHGYLSAGYGKIAHNRFLEDDIRDYTPGYYKMMNRPADVTHPDAALRRQIMPGSQTKLWSDGWSWGVLPDDWDRDDPKKMQQDTEQANRTIALLRDKHRQPFFLACGFWKPHVPWTVPQRYLDLYPLAAIAIPPGYKADDLEDLPAPARWLATHRGEHDFVVKHGLWRQCLQAFYASISYVDEQIGRLLDALEAGPNRDNTIIVFAADNGWHTGEKNHWSKFYLSELACQVVFAISVPGMKPQICPTPVGLIDIYPTLLSLCGLAPPATHTLDGVDLSAILRGTTSDRGKPVLSTYGRGCHSVRDARFRYTRYRNGDEELYDHDADRWEWNNLAGDSRFAAVKQRLAAYLPTDDAPDVESVAGRDGDDTNKWEDEAFAKEPAGAQASTGADTAPRTRAAPRSTGR